MERRDRRYFSEEFKERVLSAYRNGNEPISSIAERFGIKRDTLASWVYRRPSPLDLEKRDKLAVLNSFSMKQEEMSQGALLARIGELEQALMIEKMHSESLTKMIEIAERELKVDIRKKTGAKRSLR